VVKTTIVHKWEQEAWASFFCLRERIMLTDLCK
jgi:hypothetical protein